MFLIQNLVRPRVLAMPGYVSARHLAKRGKIFLDANENAFGSVLPKIAGITLNRYPDPLADSLRSKLAVYAGVKSAQILIGNGSDEIIWLLLFAFLGVKDEVVIPTPTFAMYEVFAGLTEGVVKKVALESDYSLNTDKVLQAVTKKTKLIFLCSPNNPTGQVLPLADIEKILKKSQKLVVVDEAYIEFAPAKTAVKLLKKYPNLLILRTFSKAWGLAGLRVGYALGNPEVIKILAKLRAPYSVDALSARLAEQALGKKAKMQEFVRKIVVERKKLMVELSELGLKVFPSDANFLLVKFSDSAKVQQGLLKQAGIVIRDFGTKPGLNNCARITIGTSAENAKLVSSLKKILK